MIKTSKHILKYNTSIKNNLLEQVYNDYKACLQYYVDLIIEGKLSRLKNISTKYLPEFSRIKYSHWKMVIYQQASELVKKEQERYNNKKFKRYQKVYRYFVTENRQLKFLEKRYNELNLKNKLTIDIKKVNMRLTQQMWEEQHTSHHFDEFIRISLPYFTKLITRPVAIRINVPIKHHRISLKFKRDKWKKLSTINITRDNKGRFFIVFHYELNNPKIKTEGMAIGFDCGYKKLLSCSDGKYYGRELEQIYEKIARTKQNSKAFKRALKQRDYAMNEVINNINLENIKHIIVEDLKGLQQNSSKRIHKKFNNKLQRWSYRKTLNKLQSLCEENGILFTKVSPAYTSQRCSNCGNVDSESRNGEHYHCSICDMKLDADTNASLNILHRGLYATSTNEIVN